MARAYARNSWAVVPLHTVVDGTCDCRRDCFVSPGKHPRTQRGFKDASTDLAKVERWWGMWPHANIGIATGAVSGIVVIDIDPRNGGLDTVQQFADAGKTFRRTAQVLTQAGGWHLYYRYPEDGDAVSGQVGPGIDLKADGGYVVAPPSVGVDGAYIWQVAMDLEAL